MKKNNKIRSIIALALSATACFGFGAVASACSEKLDPNIYVTEEEFFNDDTNKNGPHFLEGALTVIEVYDTMLLDEFVQYVEGADYTLLLKDEAGNVEDLTGEVYWEAISPGRYELEYTIKSGKHKGTATFAFEVKNPKLEFGFSLQYLPYLYGETLVFDDYFGEMNIYTSLEDCEVYMDSVEVDDQIIDLKGKEEYTFASMSDHTFKFYAKASDGQISEGREVISIKYIDQNYMAELEEMGISLYGELYVEDGNFTMIAGNYCNGNDVWLRRENGPHNLPYLAYNGNYGVGDYVKVDFTGKNMPIFSFFRDEYSKSIFDGTKGVAVTGGFTTNKGAAIHPTLCDSTTLYGPYMLHEYDREAADTTTLGRVSGAGSLNSLQEDTHYRMILGLSGIRRGRANKLGTTTPVDTVFLDFECLIIDLDAKEVFAKYTLSSYGIQALGFDEISVENAEEFFSGNIVLYGNHGINTKFDKIYPIISGMSFAQICEEEAELSCFKEDANAFLVDASEVLNVSDYVDTSKEGYDFYYCDVDGNRYDVDGETFVLGEAGDYVFYYSDGTHLYASLNVFVADFSDDLLAWVKANEMTFSGLGSLTEDYALTLKAGTLGDGASYVGPNSNNLVNQAYVAFNGTYGMDDYVAFDFTGKNMPEVAFFAQNYNNSMYYQNGDKQGVVVVSGMTTFDGKVNEGVMNGGKGIGFDSPFMIENVIDTWFRQDMKNDSALGRANLVDGKHYRVIMGFTGGSAHGVGGITLNWYLYDLDENKVLEEGKMGTWNFFTGTNARVNYMTLNDLVGSIVLYGKFATETMLDKVYGVYENSSIERVANTLMGINRYTDTYNATMNGKSVTLNGGNIVAGGTYIGPNAGELIDQAYVAFHGEYGFNDYLSLDFKGKNMPEIAFFAENYNKSMYYQDGGKKGVVVASGITLWDGSVNGQIFNGSKKVGISGPYMANFNGATSETGGNVCDAFDSALARANLADNVNYRVIIGFTSETENTITLRYALYNMDTGALVEEKSVVSYGVFNNTDFYEEKVSSLVGSIVLYGKFKTATTVDRVEIHEDTTIADICATLGMN